MIDASHPESLETIKAALDRVNERRASLLEYGKQVRARMAQSDDTDAHAMLLADLCVEFDVRFNNSPLTLEWTLDHYIAFEFERRAYPRFLDIWNKLSSGGYHYKNRVEYFNGTAYYIPHATRKVCVYGSEYNDKPRYLVIDDDPKALWRVFWVRHIWDRTKLDCLGGIERPTLALYRENDFAVRDVGRRFYGDCRDPGHVLTHERQPRMITDGVFGFQEHGKADHVRWDLNAPLAWFRETSCLWSELFELPPATEASHGA